jgi:hypothetical protein
LIEENIKNGYKNNKKRKVLIFFYYSGHGEVVNNLTNGVSHLNEHIPVEKWIK